MSKRVINVLYLFIILNKERLCKTRSGEDHRDVRHGVGRLAAITEDPERCSVTIFSS